MWRSPETSRMLCRTIYRMRSALSALTLLGLFAASVGACYPQDDPKEKLRKAIGKVREQKNYRVKYKAVIKVPNSDPMVIDGTSVWVSPGVVYVHYRASGGDEKRIIRVGNEVWIYHEFLEDWVTAEEMGNKGAGRGVQNPEEVLAVVQKHAEAVEAAGEEKVGKRSADAYGVKMTGPEIESIMKEQATAGTFDWKSSKASAKILVDKKDGLIYKFSSVADLKSTDPNVSGMVRYTAEVEVLSYGGAASYTFKVRDPKSGKEKAIPVPGEILDKIRNLRKAGSDK